MPNSCIACGFHLTHEVYHGADQPLSVLHLPRSHEEARDALKFPMNFRACANCGHIFNVDFDYYKVPYEDNSNLMYNQARAWKLYMQGLIDELVEDHGARGKTLVDIGCGDGGFLALLLAKGLGNRCIGFEPGAEADNARKNGLWGNIMAGGAGVEWYFGYQHPHSDLTCQDFRTREKVWTQCRYALEFFKTYEIPFWEMKCEDDLTENTDDYVLCKPGEVYLVYLKHGGKVRLDVTAGRFSYGWFNPRTGDGLDGLLGIGSTNAGRKVEVATPDRNDWLLVVRGEGKLKLTSRQPPPAPMVPAAEGAIVLRAVDHFTIVTGDGFVPAYKDQGHNALAINPDRHRDKFAAAETMFTAKPGIYNVTLTTLAETDGESTYRLLIGSKLIGEFTNPQTTQDYKPMHKTWKGVLIAKGAKIRIEFNAVTNSKARQGRRKAYSRGRWTTLVLAPAGAT